MSNELPPRNFMGSINSLMSKWLDGHTLKKGYEEERVSFSTEMRDQTSHDGRPKRKDVHMDKEV